MKTPRRAFRAIAAVTLLVTTISQTAQAACLAGDLAGDWSIYSTIVGTEPIGGDTRVFMQRCAVTLTSAGTAPVRYSVSGECLTYSPTLISPPMTLSGDASLTVTRSCSLRGRMTFDENENPMVLTIVDARVEDQTRKGQINGVGRVPADAGFLVYHFNFIR